MRYLATALLALGMSAHGQTVLYDTFNEAQPDILFDCCNGVQVGSTKPAGKSNPQVEVPFTVPVKTKIIEIDIPLYSVAGAQAFKVEVIGEHGNKHAFFAQNVPPEGQCCTFSALEATGIAVAPGGHYSILVHRLQKHRNQGGWNFNTIGQVGDYVVHDFDGDHPINGILPAMRIIGK